MTQELFLNPAIRAALLIDVVTLKDGLVECRFEIEARDCVLRHTVIPRDRFLKDEEGRGLLIDEAVGIFELTLRERFPGIAPHEIKTPNVDAEERP